MFGEGVDMGYLVFGEGVDMGYLVFREGVDQGAIDVVDGDEECHNNDILGCGYVESVARIRCSHHSDVVG